MEATVDFHRWKEDRDGRGGEEDLPEALNAGGINFIGLPGMGSRVGAGARRWVDGVEGDLAEGSDVRPAGFEFDGGDVETAAFAMGGGDPPEDVEGHMFGDKALERGSIEDGVG